ncbi:hypothetical protein [Rhodospira trueperi]|uniref:hypothetical protein n=1 Tax=Rhodospira trueperi TaxID=69960 RepID=UPI00115FEFD9|nr:hypothetical protein [Rhodospira trueperi]
MKDLIQQLVQPSTSDQSWPSCPVFPPDLFAATAYLLDIAGAYHYLAAGETPPGAAAWDADDELDIDFHIADGPAFLRSARTHKSCRNAAKKWFDSPRTPDLVLRLWSELGTHKDEKAFLPHTKDTVAPRWWSLACSLMVIADQACPDVGYGFLNQDDAEAPHSDGGGGASTLPQSGKLGRKSETGNAEGEETGAGTRDRGAETQSWTSLWFKIIIEYKLEKSKNANQHNSTNATSLDGHVHIKDPLWTLCFGVDPDISCVQAKSRSRNIGCSLRNMSLNLALVPPRGIVCSVWHQPPFMITPDDEAVLNILLVPFPFRIPAKSFRGTVSLKPQDVHRNKEDYDGVSPWGRFCVDQRWLHGEITDDDDKRESEAKIREKEMRRALLRIFLDQLVWSAKKDVSFIHGIIFPEYSLDWKTYEVLSRDMCRQHSRLEFFVSGSSENCEGEKGNYAISSVFTKTKNGATNKAIGISTSRAKHHRWRLDESQITTYALASALDPRILWWENIRLTKREVHVNVFRENSTFAAMICEDLARGDPCHPILRGMAPNLVFVLLMDGPQLATRWSSRYSTTLADEPGSSVLTLTSRALIERSNTTLQGRSPSWSVALWKDDSGKEVSINCEVPAHGVVLSLSGYRTSEVSLDGRCNAEARSWRYNGHQPVSVTQPSPFAETEISRDLLMGIVGTVTGEVDEVPADLQDWYDKRHPKARG